MGAIIVSEIPIVLIVAIATVLAKPAIKAVALDSAVVADIPFAFQIGSYHLPAGRYKLEMIGNDLLSIRGDSDSAVMLVRWESASRPSADSRILFHHYGNQYFLREVRTAGSEGIVWYGETKEERRAKLEEDARNPNSEPREDSKVEIALLAPPR